MKRLFLTFLILTLLLAGCAEKKPEYRPNLELQVTEPEMVYTFQAQPSRNVSLSAEDAQMLLELVQARQPEYPYAPAYQMEELERRLDFNTAVSAHRVTALDSNGNLNAANLAILVEKNNEAFLAQKPFGMEAVDRDTISRLCELIVRTVREMQQRYPNLDWDRISCNLGNLKIVYDVGMLSYAQVTPEMVLCISQTNTRILLNTKGETAFRDVIIHEIMHILQLGCACEQIEHCRRRAGICVNWQDFPLNSGDWTWLVEGSADRNMCRITGSKALSYQYKMDYINSMTLSLLLREDVQPDTLDTLCFYAEPERLFQAFGCETQDQRQEVIKLMTTMQLLQMQPYAFYEALSEMGHPDPRETDETMEDFSYSLKPDICLSMARSFYGNLISVLTQRSLPETDVFFLINLFEGHMERHLHYLDPERDIWNTAFLESCRVIRSALFRALAQDGEDMEAAYASYAIADGDGTLNADLTFLSQEKRLFLTEQAKHLDSQLSLGKKIP